MKGHEITGILIEGIVRPTIVYESLYFFGNILLQENKQRLQLICTSLPSEPRTHRQINWTAILAKALRIIERLRYHRHFILNTRRVGVQFVWHLIITKLAGIELGHSMIFVFETRASLADHQLITQIIGIDLIPVTLKVLVQLVLNQPLRRLVNCLLLIIGIVRRFLRSWTTERVHQREEQPC